MPRSIPLSVGILALMLSCAPCLAGAAGEKSPKLTAWDIEHDYVSAQGFPVDMRLLVSDPGTLTLAARVSVYEGLCSGSMFGFGVLSNHVLVLQPFPAEAGGKECRVTITFNASGAEAEVKESEACFFYHGARCSFESTVRRVK